jgi:hypothetical protein
MGVFFLVMALFLANDTGTGTVPLFLNGPKYQHAHLKKKPALSTTNQSSIRPFPNIHYLVLEPKGKALLTFVK